MDERLGFELDIDADTHKLPPAVQLLTQMDERLMRIGRSLERFEQGTRQMGDHAQRVRGLTSGFTEMASAISLVERGLGIAARAWGVFERGGDYAVKAMGERTATIRGYTQLLGGDKKQANLEYYRAQEFSQKTDFSSEQIEKSQARLLAQGFRGKDLYATLFSAADLAAIMPGDKNQTLERVTMAMSQIKAKGKLQGEELTQQLAEAGLNTTLVKQQLMKSLGLKSTAEVDKKMGKGEIGADVALPAIQRAILQQLGTTKAGEYSTSSAGSLTALISNRDEAVKNVLKGFDADENLPAMDRYKKALTEQGKLFDQNSKTGKELSLVVQDMANAALEAKSAWSEFSNGFIESFAGSYARELNASGRSFDAESTTVAIRNLGEAIGRLGSAAAQAMGGTGGLTANLAQRGANVVNKDLDRFSMLADGDYWGAAKSAGQSLLDRLPGSLLVKHTPVGTLANHLYDKYGPSQMMSSADDFSMQDESARRAKAGITPTIAKVSKAEQLAAKVEAAKKGREQYRGVFWDYDFNGQSTGQWAQPPTIGDVMQGSHTTATALTNAVAARGSDQSVVININGYNKDKMELARTIASELSRLGRSPR